MADPAHRLLPLMFINYRAADSAWAVLLDRELSERFGADRVFLASRSIPPTADFPVLPHAAHGAGVRAPGAGHR